MIAATIELMIALLILGLYYLVKKDFARACHFSVGFLCIWYWGTTAIYFFLGLPILGIASLVGATGGYAAFSNSAMAAVAGAIALGTITFLFFVLMFILSAMCIVGAHLLRAGTNFPTAQEFDGTKLFVGGMLILVPTLSNFFF